MRTLRPVAVAVMVLALVLAGSPASGGAVFHTRFNGPIAMATWTTCPDWEQEPVGTVCRETVVIASTAQTQEVFTGGRERSKEPSFILRRYRFRIVDQGADEVGMHMLRESLGITSEATVRIDRRGRMASAWAQRIPMNTWVWNGLDYDEVSETMSASATWRGVGALRPLRDRWMHTDRRWHAMGFTKGWDRAATATGTVDGVAVAGDVIPQWTALVNARQFELTVYKGRPTDG